MMNIIYFSRADVNYSVDCIDKGNTEYVAEFVQEQTGLAFKCSGSTVKNTQKWIYDLCRQQKCGEMVIFMNIQAILVANITGFVLLLILYISRAITRIKSDTEEKAIDGHAAGDQALVDMASIMKKRFSGLGKCFRYAGDECVVLVKSDNEAEILEMENALSADVEAFNERENRPYKLSFSKGYGKF